VRPGSIWRCSTTPLIGDRIVAFSSTVCCAWSAAVDAAIWARALASAASARPSDARALSISCDEIILSAKSDSARAVCAFVSTTVAAVCCAVPSAAWSAASPCLICARNWSVFTIASVWPFRTLSL
jgi:hypothetical protein